VADLGVAAAAGLCVRHLAAAAAVLIPNDVTVWERAPILTWLMNSLVIGVMAALAVTLSSAFVAFGFVYFRFPGRNLVFGLVLATMMLSCSRRPGSTGPVTSSCSGESPCP
jgi:ABC-type glycerol-3-phosphate transport system permease component